MAWWFEELEWRCWSLVPGFWESHWLLAIAQSSTKPPWRRPFQVNLFPTYPKSFNLASSNTSRKAFIGVSLLGPRPHFSWDQRISLKSPAHSHKIEKLACSCWSRTHVSHFLVESAKPYMLVKRHLSSDESLTTALMWFGDEDITSILSEFFQNKANHPNLLTCGVTSTDQTPALRTN